jgi:MacB-like periplasmic core domain
MLWGNAHSALRALRVNTLRSVLTMLGIVIGVAAVIAMVAVGAGAQERVAEQIRSLGSNQLVVVASTTNLGGVRGGAGTRIALSDDDAFAMQRELPAVQAAAPTLGRTLQVVRGNLNWGTLISGVTTEWFVVKDWRVLEGRPITLEDYHAAAKVAIIGLTAASPPAILHRGAYAADRARYHPRSEHRRRAGYLLMNRRTFIATVAGSTLARPLVASGQSVKAVRIGYLAPGTAETNAGLRKAFSDGLRDHGWTEDKSIAIEYRPNWLGCH